MSDRYRYRQYRFQGGGGGGFGFPGVTPMVKKLLIAHFAIFLLQVFLERQHTGLGWMAIHSGEFFMGAIWQPFTYMWLHGGLLHVAMNMFGLWMFGGQLESVWGSRRFLRFYLTCGVGAGLIIVLWTWSGNSYTIGASGAVYGILTAFSLMWPDRTIMLLFPPVPLRAIWLIPVLFVMQLVMDRSGNISHAGHLGGVIVAAIILRHEARRFFGLSTLRHRWHRWRMRNRLRAVRREEWERRRDDDDKTYH